MAYCILKTVSISSPVVAFSSVTWSDDNNVAVLTLNGIHIYDLFSGADKKESFFLHKNTIGNLTEKNSALLAGISRSKINAEVPKSRISDFVVDRSLLPTRVTHDFEGVGFRQISWSPAGLQEVPHSCILAALTTDYRLVLYGSKQRKWAKLYEPSTLLVDFFQKEFSEIPRAELTSYKLAEEAKRRAYQLSTLCVAWGSLVSKVSEKWAWLFGLQRSGHLVVWRVTARQKDCVEITTVINLHIENPSTFCIHQLDNETFVVLVGTSSGLVKVYQVNLSSPSSPSIKDYGFLLPEPDSIVVRQLSICQFDNVYVVAAVKNSAICFSSFRPNFEDFQEQAFHQFPSLQITGFSWTYDGSFICSTDDGLIFSGQITVDSSDNIDVVDVNSIQSSSPHVSVKGVCHAANNKIVFCALETLKVLYDPACCKQVSFLVFHGIDDVDIVTQALKCGKSMKESAALLEAYKQLGDPRGVESWDADLEELDKKTNHHLRLLRFISLYYSNSTDCKDTRDGLRARAHLLEYCLRLQHFATMFQNVLDNETQLAAEQMLSLHLACEFASITVSTSLSTEFDFSNFCSLDLIQEIQRKIANANVKESCAVCGDSVDFEKVESGRCSRKHEAPRCVATLKLCFSRTRRCCCCAAFYQKENAFGELSECILCGGPLQ